MDGLNNALGVINGILWHDYVLFATLGAGLLFTIWSRFSQYRALTHGVAAVTGKYSKGGKGEGALSHFQALSAALSGTVGLGNIGGVAIAVALGGPGAVFWMWIVGLLGMALKTTEVTLAMLYRNTDNPEAPYGGAMYIIRDAVAEKAPSLAWLGKALGGLFCVTVIVFAFAGGNMFQAWNVGEITNEYFGVPWVVSGVILAVIVAVVILGGIQRIGTVAGTIVPLMCGIYVVCGLYVLALNASEIPAMFGLIFKSAFGSEASGAFIGGTFGYVFLWGMKRALFSSEAGLGSAPMAHSAVKTTEPVREGVVAGLEPFIDTLVVCTITALVLLSSGVWNRDALVDLGQPTVSKTADGWELANTRLPANTVLTEGDSVFLIGEGDASEDTGNALTKVFGEVVTGPQGKLLVDWDTVDTEAKPKFKSTGLYEEFVGASLTAKAFDSAQPGLGKWMVTLAVWLFAISTMISWSYYGETGMVYLFGSRSVMPYRVVYCAMAVVACLGLFKTNTELGNFADLGAGLMLVVNIPITLWLGSKAMKAYRGYIERLDAGEFKSS